MFGATGRGTPRPVSRERRSARVSPCGTFQKLASLPLGVALFPLLLRATYIAPMDDPEYPLLRDAGVVFNGGIVTAVGPFAAVRQAHPDAAIENLGDALLLPGLVNAHAHLELSDVPRPAGPLGFADWAVKLISTPPGRLVADVVRDALAASARFGVTTVGDITRDPTAVRPYRSSSFSDRPRPRVVSFGEVRAMGERRMLLEGRLRAAAEPSPWVGVGVSPHAPYSVEPDGYRRCLEVCRSLDLPLMTHLAETAEEAAFLRDHAGPLRRIWDAVGGFDAGVPTFDGGPIRFAASLGLLDYARTLLAHVNYCDDDELAILAAGKASVVYCPRTHAYFGHPPHRWREMLAAGVNVAVGTDSLASSPTLDLLEDLRLLRRLAPEVPAVELWRIGTSRGGAALGLGDVGALRVGSRADCVAFPVASDDPLVEVLDGEGAGRRVWIGGEEVFGTPKQARV